MLAIVSFVRSSDRSKDYGFKEISHETLSVCAQTAVTKYKLYENRSYVYNVYILERVQYKSQDRHIYFIERSCVLGRPHRSFPPRGHRELGRVLGRKPRRA